MRSIRKAAFAALAAALALGVTSCSKSDRDPEGDGGGGGTFTFGTASAPAMFDPFYSSDGETLRVTKQIFQGLLGIEPGTVEVVPALATEWNSDETGTVWTFELRDDVKFHDGTDFDAEAVCYNFDRMFTQSEAGATAAQMWAYVMGSFSSDPEGSLFKSCEATGDHEATITINRASSSFPGMLAVPALAMQSPTAMEKGDANGIKTEGEGYTYPDSAMNPVGTGPLKFNSFDEANGTVTLDRNDDYWGEKAMSSQLIFKAIPDESTRRQELEAGSINGYDFPNPTDWQGLTEAGNQVLVREPFNIFFLGFNPEANPKLKDLKVRQALYYALDRDQLVKTQLPEGAVAATQFMVESVAGYNSDLDPYAYDPQKAKELLAEAGAEGMTLQFAYPTEVSRPYMPDPQKLYEALRTNLEAVGVKVNVESAPWSGGYLDNVFGGKYEAFLLGNTGNLPSSYDFLGALFGDLEGNMFNTDVMPWGEQLTQDLKAADALADEDERADAFSNINEQIMEEYLPGLPISSSPPALVVGAGVKGMVASPLAQEEFDTVSVSGQ